jgi:orotate phosphoribosyltransferase
MTTFTTEDRIIAEKDGSFTVNVEPIPFAGMVDIGEDPKPEISFRISDEKYLELHQWVFHYINENCIVRDTKMPGKAPGSTYTWMFYLRNGLFNHNFLINVSQMFLYHMERADPNFNFQLTGLETAATPLLAAIPMVGSIMGIDLNAFVVRKSRKEYGLKNIIEGIPNNKMAVIIDDLCNSSMSMAQCLNSLKEEQLPIGNVAFCIVNKSNRAVHKDSRLKTDMYLPPEIKVISLYTLDDFGLTNPSH